MFCPSAIVLWYSVLLVAMTSCSTGTTGQADAFYLPAANFYCHPEDVCPPCEVCPEPDRTQQFLLPIFFYWAATFEVLARGFALGFGMRMIKYMLWDDSVFAPSTTGATNPELSSAARPTNPLEDDERMIRSLPIRCKISAAAGLSMAALMFGLSLFLPTNLRSRWYQYDSW